MFFFPSSVHARIVKDVGFLYTSFVYINSFASFFLGIAGNRRGKKKETDNRCNGLAFIYDISNL